MLLVSAGMNPINFYEKVELSSEITDTHFIAMICSDEEIRKRLKARPAERNCGSDEFIQSQIEYSSLVQKESWQVPEVYRLHSSAPRRDSATYCGFCEGDIKISLAEGMTDGNFFTA